MKEKAVCVSENIPLVDFGGLPMGWELYWGLWDLRLASATPTN